MRKFIVNKNTKLILNKKTDSLNIDKILCKRLFTFNNDGSVITRLVPEHRQRLHKVELKEYDYVEEYSGYIFVSDLNDEGEDTDYGLVVKIPHSKDRIFIETSLDFEPMDAVEIVEDD